MALTNRSSRLVLAAWAVLAARVALAAEPTDPAQHLFQRGVEAAQHGNWDEARRAFEGARELSARPVILVNLAGAQARTGHLREALASYQAIIDDTSDEAAPFRDAALSVRATLEGRVPRIRIRAAGLTADEVVALDTAPLPRAELAAPVPVDPGAHVVTVSRRGVETARVSVSLTEGEIHEVILPAALFAPRPDAGRRRFVLEQPSQEPAAPAAARSSWWRSPWLWTGLALAAGAATAGLILTSHEAAPAYAGSIPPGIIHVQ